MRQVRHLQELSYRPQRRCSIVTYQPSTCCKIRLIFGVKNTTKQYINWLRSCHFQLLGVTTQQNLQLLVAVVHYTTAHYQQIKVGITLSCGTTITKPKHEHKSARKMLFKSERPDRNSNVVKAGQKTSRPEVALGWSSMSTKISFMC